jgi:hypothetical protein
MNLAAAARADTPRALLAFQRTLKDALIRPLAPGDRTQKKWTDGRPMAEFAENFIKPNDRLTALERLQIYNRMYWFRLLDCFHDDCPGLRAALGDRRFTRLAEAYLVKYPSQSFTLRNLCARLEQFLREDPKWTAPHTALAREIARFEWAQTVAFDGESRPILTPAEFSSKPPSRLRLGVQPYVTFLELRYPVDEFVIAVKRRDALRAEASNATTNGPRPERMKKVSRPKPQRVFVAIHRVDNRLYYKRLEPAAYAILVALRDGAPLSRAIAAGGPRVTAEQVQRWFGTWMELGWFCRRK